VIEVLTVGNRSNALAELPVTYQPYLARHAYAKLLIDQGMTYREIERLTGTSSATIIRIKKGELVPNKLMTKALQQAEGGKLTSAIHDILDGSVTGKKIEAATLLQGITAAAILVDKRELIEGRPTQRISYLDAEQSAEKVAARLAELEREELTLTKGKDGTYAATSQPATTTAPPLPVGVTP